MQLDPQSEVERELFEPEHSAFALSCRLDCEHVPALVLAAKSATLKFAHEIDLRLTTHDDVHLSAAAAKKSGRRA